METLQSTIFIEFDVNTKKITFLRKDNIIDYDSNVTNIYVRVKYKDLNGNTVYLTPSELEGYEFTLYTIKPTTNNINEITGEVTDELKENTYGGVVKFKIPRACTNRLGVVKCEIHINQWDEMIASSTFILDVKQSLVTEFNDALLSDEDFPVLKQLIFEVQKANNIDDDNRSKITTYSSDKIETIKENIKENIEEISLQIEEKANQSDLEIERNRINNLASNTGTTVNDLELQDIRVGANGVTYENAGEAVRNQFKDVTTDLTYILGTGNEMNLDNKAYGNFTEGTTNTTNNAAVNRITPSFFELPNANYFVYVDIDVVSTIETGQLLLEFWNLSDYSKALARIDNIAQSCPINLTESNQVIYGFVPSSELKDGKKCLIVEPSNFTGSSYTVSVTVNKAFIIPVDDLNEEVKAQLPTVCGNSSNVSQINIKLNSINSLFVNAIMNEVDSKISAKIPEEDIQPDTNTYYPLVTNNIGDNLFNLFSPYNRNIKIVMIGDSTTDSAVSNYFDAEMRNYTKSGELLSGASVINMGKGGTTINWFLTDESNQIGTAINHNADIYTLCYGINDVREGNCDKATLVQNLSTCVDRLLNETGAYVLLITPNTMLNEDIGGHNYVVPNSSAQAYSTLLNEAYKELAKKYSKDRVQLVDMQELIFGTEVKAKADNPFMSDQLHPNTLGQRSRADVIANAIGSKPGIMMNKIRYAEYANSENPVSVYPNYLDYKGYIKIADNIEIEKITETYIALRISEALFQANVKVNDIMKIGDEYTFIIDEIKKQGYNTQWIYGDFSNIYNNHNSWHISIYRKI